MNPKQRWHSRLPKWRSPYQTERTGHAPAAVTVVLSEDTLVITLHDALTPAEKALAQSPDGAAQVQEFHRQLFLTLGGLAAERNQEDHGREVREAAAEVEPATRTVVHAFTTGDVVQVFLLATSVDWPEYESGSRTEQSIEKIGVSIMLVLSRKSREAVVIGGTSGFEQCSKSRCSRFAVAAVKLGFEAGDEVPIHRAEVWERIRARVGHPISKPVAPRPKERVPDID